MAAALHCIAVLAGCALGAPEQPAGSGQQQYMPGGGAPGQAGSFDFQQFIPGSYRQFLQGAGSGPTNYSQSQSQYNSQYMAQYKPGGASNESQQVQGGGAVSNYSQQYAAGGANQQQSDFQKFVPASYRHFLMGAGNGATNYSQSQSQYNSQYMALYKPGGADNASQPVQGGGVASNYSQQYAPGGANQQQSDFQKFVPGSYRQFLGAAAGGSNNLSQSDINSQYMSMFKPGAANNSQQVAGGGYMQGGSNFSQYTGAASQGGAASFNFQQFMGGAQPQPVQGEAVESPRERLARVKADASGTLHELKTLRDQLASASPVDEERGVRQHMFGTLPDKERDTFAAWKKLNQEFYALTQAFQRDGTQWSQAQRLEAVQHAGDLDRNLTSLEEQLADLAGSAERFVGGFSRQRVKLDEAKAADLVRVAGRQSMEMDALARSLGSSADEKDARDVNATAEALARDVGGATESLARSIEEQAHKSEEFARQSLKDDQGLRRAVLHQMRVEGMELRSSSLSFDAAVTRGSDTPTVLRLRRLLMALMVVAPMMLAVYLMRLPERRVTPSPNELGYINL